MTKGRRSVRLNNILCNELWAGIVARYGLDGRGVGSRRGRDFPQLSISAMGPAHPPVLGIVGLFTGSKAGWGAWR